MRFADYVTIFLMLVSVALLVRASFVAREWWRAFKAPEEHPAPHPVTFGFWMYLSCGAIYVIGYSIVSAFQTGN